MSKTSAERLLRAWQQRLAHEITFLREEAGLTKKEVGDLLGVSGQAVGHWEANRCQPTVHNLLHLAIVCEASPGQLFKRIGVK